MGTEPAPVATPRRWPVALSWVVFAFLLLAGPMLAFFGLISYKDAHNHWADRWWGIGALVVMPFLLLTCVALLWFLIGRQSLAWSAAMILIGLSVLALLGEIGLGFAVLSEAKGRGGDWGALSVLAAWVFGIGCPGVAGILTLAAAGCLLLLRGERH
jgi:hypothetical protein